MSNNNAIRTIADRAHTLHHEGINGNRPIGDFAEYFSQVKKRLTEAIGSNQADMDENIEIATLQVADDLLQELSDCNIPREGREFIKSYGMQLLYERLKRKGRLEEYLRRLNSFKLKRRNEIRNRLEKYDASRREKIALFQSSIRDVVLAPRAERVRRIEEETFWGRVPEQLRVWVDSCARESISNKLYHNKADSIHPYNARSTRK